MLRKRPDRAQTMRSRRLWWARNGAFVRGMLSGIALTLIVGWVLKLALGYL